MKKIRDAGIFLGFCLIVLFVNGCATSPGGPGSYFYFPEKINSTVAPDADLKNKIYVISSAIRNVKDDDPQFKEFAKYIENALLKSGYTRVDSELKADLVLRLSFGLGDPQTITSNYTSSYGYSYPVGWMWYTVPPATQTVNSTVYRVQLVLTAYDLKKRSQVWKTTLESSATSTDLHESLTYMITSAIEYFGTNTDKDFTIDSYSNDPRVADIIKSEPDLLPLNSEEKTNEKEKNQATAVEQKGSNADEILKYKKLLDSGAITKEEYDQKKKQLLGL